MSDRAPAAREPVDELALTKLNAPVPRSGHVARPQLVDRVSTGVAGALLLIAAPTGYGKSVVVAAWAAAAAAPVAWLCLDAADNDPVLLTRYLIAALRRAGAQVSARTEQLVQVPGAPPRAWMAALVNDLVQPTDVVLVLEDYHVLDDPGSCAVVQYLLEHAPPTFHLVIITRADPALPLAALRADGQLSELRAADLRFTADEATAWLVDVEGLPLSEDAMAELIGRTEGWPAGLYLAALWLRSSAAPERDALTFAGSNRHVVDYLMEVVLDELPTTVRDALLQSSVVDRLCAALCTALVGEPGRELLHTLERSNLFLIPLDPSRTWFRFHHLFRDVLRSELHRRAAHLLPDLHRRAAAWYREAGLWTESIEHALAGDDVEQAAELVWQNWLPVARRGQHATIGRWLKAFDDDQLRGAPELGVVGGLVVGVAGGSQLEFRRWLAVAHGEPPAIALPRAAHVGLDFLRSTFDYDSVPSAIAAARSSLDNDPLAQGELRTAALANLGQLCYFAGDLRAARRTSSAALRDPQSINRPYAHITALTTAALAELDDGTPATGERLARQALDYALAVGLDTHQVAGLAHTALGRAQLAGGRPAQGRLELLRGVDMVMGGLLPLREAYALLHLAAAERTGPRPQGAHELIDRADALVAGFVDPGAIGRLLQRARAQQTRAAHRRDVGPSPRLSPAQVAVLRLLDSPRSQRSIAASLSLSINTVKSHTTAIYRALGVSSRADAVSAGHRLALLSDDQAPEAGGWPTTDG